MMTELEYFFYHSRLADDVNVNCVSAIIKTARAFNQDHRITGLLVFDGESFCQYIEGPRPALWHLIHKLESDPRHTNFTPLLRQALTGPRLYPNWSMAYAELDDDTFVNQLRAQPTDVALTFLNHNRNRLDIR